MKNLKISKIEKQTPSIDLYSMADGIWFVTSPSSKDIYIKLQNFDTCAESVFEVSSSKIIPLEDFQFTSGYEIEVEINYLLR